MAVIEVASAWRGNQLVYLYLGRRRNGGEANVVA